MRPLPTILPLALALAPLHAETLSVPEREALLERLDGLRDAARDKVDTKFRGAETAFRTGMASDEAALQLYEKCVQKVDFEDKNRDSQDFREWRRRNKDRMDGPGYARALRHQLGWLVLSLQAASREDLGELGPKAREALLAIFSEAEVLRPQRGLLESDVFASVFARAYGLAGMEIENWPSSPLPVDPVYEGVVFPPLRRAGDPEVLRTAWVERIKSEAAVFERMTGGERDKNDPLPLAYTKYLAETQPDLIWRMEEDVYKAGDQRGAALRMLEHLEKNIAHRKASEWEARFRGLVDPPKEEKTAGDGSIADEAG